MVIFVGVLTVDCCEVVYISVASRGSGGIRGVHPVGARLRRLGGGGFRVVGACLPGGVASAARGGVGGRNMSPAAGR